MSFKKDGEVKVYVAKSNESKNASEEKEDRYTVDDLVKDSDDTTNQVSEAEEKDVPN